MKLGTAKKAAGVIRRDGRVMLTTTREPYPFVVDRAAGDFAYDIDGNRFIDFTSFISVYNFGNNANAEIRKAVKAQVEKLMHAAFLDYYAEAPVAFAENLLTMFPRGFGRVFFSNSGTEANEDAIKLARIFTKKPNIISFYGAFHGRSLGSLGLTASRVSQRERLGPFAGAVHSIYPNIYRDGNGDPEEVSKACILHLERNILAKECSPDEVAAIFVEPVQGEGGYIVPPVSFIKELRRVCDDNNMLLVSDEVQAGYMRTGKFLAMDNFHVAADIYTMAKAAGGGLPLGITVSRGSLGDVPAGAHGGTFGGNLVSIAAASATLKYVKRNQRKLQSMVKVKGKRMMRRLLEMKSSYGMVGDARGLGMMLAIELVKDKKSKAPAVREREAIVKECFGKGLLLMPCGTSTIRIIPPITMSTEHIDRGLDVLEDAIRTVSGK